MKNNTLKNENRRNEKIIEERNNIKISSSKSLNIRNRDVMESFDKNKIDILFDISENKHENTETYSDEESDCDNVNNKKIKRRAKIERNLLERKKTLHNIHVINEQMGYKIKKKDRKVTQREKKLGNNLSDFII